MEVVGEAILSAAVESLFGVLTSQECLKFATQQQVDKELKKWESKLSLIQGVLNDAEEKRATNQAVKIWLTRLRDLAYDAEDILDEFHTEALQSKLNSAKSQASTSHVRRNKEMATKLQRITERLEEIVNEKKDLDLDTTGAGGRSKKVNETVPTTSLVKEPKVYGREKDKEAIVELLMRCEASNSPCSVIPIIGMGGLGKTTLAQLIYHDETLAFDCKAWVCVSDDFDILKITKTILQHWESCEANDLNVLQEKLKKILHGKKFLIVLDDVWNENYDLWTALRIPFAAASPGSIIIVTARSKVVSSQMGSVPGYELKGLANDDCMSLFAQHALGVENFDVNTYLKEIGEQIVQKCKGLPLAAKTLGGLLRGNQSIEEWEVILNSKIWDLPQDQSNILPALRLSYHFLPSHLKRCFAFCAIFPKDYEFDKNELVLLWMAEGFLQQPKKGIDAEDLGHGYFNDLLSRSFFQQSSETHSLYVMHDLISDLALFVSEEICFGLADKPTNDAGSYSNVRHSSFTAQRYDIWQRFEIFCEMKALRTFIALRDPKMPYPCLSRKVVDDLVPKIKCLRSLSLAGYSSLELPDIIGTLKRLRYLNLSFSGIEKLPRSVTDLFNLQTLLLCGCRRLVELPTDIDRLINLQYLDVSGTDRLEMKPQQISQMIDLSSLSELIAGEQGSGLGIGELRKFCHLQGRLLVTQLHNVSNVGDAKLANLKEKPGLRELALEWKRDDDDSPNQRDELQVLLSLQPNSNLEKLSVTSYCGIVFPSWLGDSSFNKIVELRLHNCRNVTSLPSIARLTKLRQLSIGGMNEVKVMIIEALPALETLIIEDMQGWEQWSWSHDPNTDAAEEFPKLCKLELNNCPKFVGKLPSSLSYLKELTVEGCQALVLKHMTDLASLATLKISRISGLASLYGTLVQTLVAIEYLYISYCDDLKCLWEDGNDLLNKLAKLKLLEINDCEQLASLVEGEEGFLPSNLQELCINGCFDLKKLPNGLHTLTSLRRLVILGCPKLLSFPEKAGGLPYSLKHLSIFGCDSLESLPHGMMSGPNSNQCLLEELWIEACPSLRSFPEGKLPTTLQHLEIRYCENLDSLPMGIMCCDPQEEEMSSSRLECLSITDLPLTSFPAGEFPLSLKSLRITSVKIQSLPSSHSLTHLTGLRIIGCNELESFPVERLPLPNLMTLAIMSCQNLRSLSGFIDNLTSLRELRINLCSSLSSFTACGLPPTLTYLSVGGCENLRQPMSEWGLRPLTSLQHLEIGFQSPFHAAEGVNYFPDDGGLLLPTSVTFLDIHSHENLKSISRGIQHLTSLEFFFIDDCPKLQFLPKEGFPATLGSLSIDRCPLLEQRCKRENGDYWPIIAHIPDLRIYN